jgi:PAS domain-containing protein
MDTERNAELADAIVKTVQLPLLVLDADLRVVLANDAFLRQFRVAPDDTVGRKVYELGNGQWDIPELRRLLGEILPERGTVTGFRIDHSFERIGRRIMHLNARRVAGGPEREQILLAISDDTEREGLRAALEARMELADKLIDSVREGLLILDPDLRVHSASAAFYETFAVVPSETRGRLIYELGNGQWDIPELRRLLENVLPTDERFEGYRVEHAFPNLGARTMLLNARRLQLEGQPDRILLAIEDVTDRPQAAEQATRQATPEMALREVR